MSTGCLWLQRVPHGSQFASITGRFQLHHHSGPASYFPPAFPAEPSQRVQESDPQRRSKPTRMPTRVWRLSGVSGVSPTWFPPNISGSQWSGSEAIQWASVRQPESRWPREVWRDSSIVPGIVYKFLHQFKKHGTRRPIIYKIWKYYIDPHCVKSVYLKRPVVMWLYFGIYQEFQNDTCFAVRRVTFGHSLKYSNLKQAHARVHAHIISTSALSPQQQ